MGNNIQASNNEVAAHNDRLEGQLRPLVERRRSQLQKQGDLRSALGFGRRDDAPKPIPLERKLFGPARRHSTPTASRTARVEQALDDADYEDVITVIRGMLRALERTPSLASREREEFLRNVLLVTLNGTYQGAGTGETFVRSGKTDILIKVEDRHVFVGECKWWEGPAGASAAVDQLLGYLPWRDEKAALIFFIDRKGAGAILDEAERVIRLHRAYKRLGASSSDPAARRNFLLAHPDDPEKAIHLAVLFAVFPPKGAGADA
jgi:hypothetical protein